MNRPDTAHADEQFTLLLARYSEVLMAGGVADPAANAALTPELRQRLERALDCLRRLRQYLPSGESRTISHSAGDSATVVLSGSITLHDGMASGEVGRFRIVHTLGHGGGGIVFLAHDPLLRRKVAVKIPRLEALLTPQLRLRFLREARAAAGLNHPNLVPVYEAGEVDGLCFIVSAYCPGLNLADWLVQRKTPVSGRMAAELVAVLADAVEYIHGCGLYHRDIKPSNILLDPSGAPPGGELRWLPRLTDFGLAKRLNGQTEVTRSGTLLGTVQYMAPEQAEGRVRDIGPCTDVYGLGAVLYELLTGRPPFRGLTDADTLRQVLANEPLPPRHLRRDVPGDLETICLKCLHKQPGRRYASARELADDLRRFLAGQPIWARPAGRIERLGKWARRRPARVALTCFIVLLGLGLVIEALSLQAMMRDHNANVTLTAQQQEQQREQLRQHQQSLRQYRYADDMALAWRDWSDGPPNDLAKQLQRHRPVSGQADPDDPRGFEWYYLALLSGSRSRSPATLSWLAHEERNQPRGAWAVAFSPDSKTLASAGDDRTVRLWDPNTGRQKAVLRGHQSLVSCLAYSPDGKRLATGSSDESATVKLWDAATGDEIATLWGHTRPVYALAFAPDGKTLATAGRDRVVRLWDVDACTERPEAIVSHEVESLTFSPDSPTLALTVEQGPTLLWDLEQRKVRGRLSSHARGLVAVAFSPDGKTLASGDREGTVRFWDAASGDLRSSARLHTGPVNCLAFAPDGKTLASASFDKTVKLWQTSTGHELLTLSGHADRVRWVTFSRDGRMLATAGHDGVVKIYRAATEDELPQLSP
jgi:WD40 repeat protein